MKNLQNPMGDTWCWKMFQTQGRTISDKNLLNPRRDTVTKKITKLSGDPWMTKTCEIQRGTLGDKKSSKHKMGPFG